MAPGHAQLGFKYAFLSRKLNRKAEAAALSAQAPPLRLL